MERKKRGKNRKGCRSYMRYGERNKCMNTLEDQKEKREHGAKAILDNSQEFSKVMKAIGSRSSLNPKQNKCEQYKMNSALHVIELSIIHLYRYSSIFLFT